MLRRSFPLLVVLFFLAVFFITAWVADDAYITLRSVDNFVNGYGLRWNVAERVQSYTHPLWLLALVPFYALTRDAYFTALIVSLAFSLATLAVVLRFSSLPNALPALVVLLVSKAFIDFSVSGLENPATHFFLALFIVPFLEKTDTTTPKRLLLLGLAAALGILNRMDIALIYAPALLYLHWQGRRPSTLGWLLLAFAPLLLWEAFSLIYYGFPFPNTAYAKLNTGIPALALAQQTLVYYTDSLQRDPITLSTTLLVLPLTFWKGGTKERLLAAGAALYLLYLFRTGGDFMSGRFFSAPLLVAVLLSMRLLERLPQTRWKYGFSILALIAGLLAPYPTLWPHPDQPLYTESDLETGINDERAFYYPVTGLRTVITNGWELSTREGWVEHGLTLRASGKKVAQENNIGLVGYYAGPQVYLIDIYALSDPLLARLPIPNPNEWRIGHFERDLPDGYSATLNSGVNRLRDPQLAAYYDKLTLVVRGPLWRLERLRAIWELNTSPTPQQ